MDSIMMVPGQEFKELVQDLKEVVTAWQSGATGFKKEFVGNEEFMELMGISKRTAQSWRDEGTIAFSQIGSKIYYKMADVNKLLDENRRGTFAELNKKGGK